LNLLERGSIEYLFPGKRIEIRKSQLFLFWAGVPHQLVSKTEDTYIHWMTFPLAWLIKWHLSDGFIQPLLNGQPAIDSVPSYLSVDLAAFYRWHADLENGEETRKNILILELEARIRRLALAITMSSGNTKIGVSINGTQSTEFSRKAERMALFLSENFTQECSPERTARVVGVHPNYAMSIFQRAFGISMVVYVTQLRVAMAQKLLVTSSMEILDIAFECGFGSASRFYSAFKTVTGTTPHRYRKSMQGYG
jgi:AraC family transcriptional regulator, melibiose operon regulatory protein